MNHTVTYTTVTSDEPVVAVHAEDLTLVAELLDHVARWLATAPDAVHADLASFPVPDPTGPDRLLEELGARARHLRHLAKGTPR